MLFDTMTIQICVSNTMIHVQHLPVEAQKVPCNCGMMVQHFWMHDCTAAVPIQRAHLRAINRLNYKNAPVDGPQKAFHAATVRGEGSSLVK